MLRVKVAPSSASSSASPRLCVIPRPQLMNWPRRRGDAEEDAENSNHAIDRALGPGLLESAYIQCLCYELTLRKIPFELELSLPVVYKGIKLDCGYRVDMVVVGAIVVEVKAIEDIAPVHEAQLLTYLRMGGWQAGRLINFNVPVLRDGFST
jgi:GxxExxY protein